MCRRNVGLWRNADRCLFRGFEQCTHVLTEEDFFSTEERVVLIVQYGDQQELRIGHMGYEGFFIDEETGACLEDEDGQVTHWCHISALPE